ncbi:Hpt domain-containing protein [Orrella marina]|nr:Hpt domain-containing protein [Orrella marina]
MTQGIIDRSALLHTAGEDHELGIELLEIFVRTFAQDIETLATAIQADDIQGARHILHRLKGSLQILGVHHVAVRIDRISESLYAPIAVEQARSLKDLFEYFQAIMDDATSILDAGTL